LACRPTGVHPNRGAARGRQAGRRKACTPTEEQPAVHRRFQQSRLMQVAIRGHCRAGTRGRAKPTGPSVSLALLSLVLKATIVACQVSSPHPHSQPFLDSAADAASCHCRCCGLLSQLHRCCRDPHHCITWPLLMSLCQALSQTVSQAHKRPSEHPHRRHHTAQHGTAESERAPASAAPRSTARHRTSSERRRPSEHPHRQHSTARQRASEHPHRRRHTAQQSTFYQLLDFLGLEGL
jgi:hypothetical protein